MDAGRDGAVLANAASVVASLRQIEAAAAYARGDEKGAQALINQNVRDLQVAAAAAPAAAAPLRKQMAAYESNRAAFAAPRFSEAGRAAAKSVTEKNMDNSNRAAGF